jgi:hypothetical protein
MYFERAICPLKTQKTQKKKGQFPEPGSDHFLLRNALLSVKPSKKKCSDPRPKREAVSVQLNVHFYKRVFTEPAPPV